MSIFINSQGSALYLKKFVLYLCIVMVGFFLVSTFGVFAESSTYVLDPKDSEESMWDCGGLGGSWSNINSTCMLRTNFTLDSGNVLKIDLGASLDLMGRSDDAISLGVNSESKIDNYGTIIIHSNSALHNGGTINNFDGGVINSTWEWSIMQEWSSISNDGVIVNHNGGIILNYRRGIWSGNGANPAIFVNNGTIVNSGEIYNLRKGHFETYGNIINKGAIINRGNFDIYSTIDNQNGSLIYTILNNQKSYVIYNYESSNITVHDKGSISNLGAILNRGKIEINGDILNKGVIDNYGFIMNNGNTINNSNGTIINHNIGRIENKGDIDNYGNLTSIFGRISNSGNIKNCGGTIDGTIFDKSAANICISTTNTTTTRIITVTSSIERIAEPAIYAWAVGASITSIVLAAILILRKRS